MFLSLFYNLRQARVPVSVREYLTLLEAVEQGLAGYSVEEFYFLARATLIKDERHLDKFDQVFGQAVHGVIAPTASLTAEDLAQVPAEWLRAMAEKYLTPEELAKLQAMESLQALLDTLAQRLAEQKAKHQGGNKWLGTGGTSPFGAYGANPAGIRIGQSGNRNNRAVKVWDKREFKNLDDNVELGTRNFRLALRRLRRFARDGAATEFDVDQTIRATARQGMLDVHYRPERRNKIKVLLLLDVGGSMDPFIQTCEELFSAARSEFKHLEHYYFHNCPYGTLWKDMHRRQSAGISTMDILHRYPSDWKIVFVGDASMSPWEILEPGAAVEEFNDEAGRVWMERITNTWKDVVWLNPAPRHYWAWTQSIKIMRDLVQGRMFPLTLEGLDGAMSSLTKGTKGPEI